MQDVRFSMSPKVSDDFLKRVLLGSGSRTAAAGGGLARGTLPCWPTVGIRIAPASKQEMDGMGDGETGGGCWERIWNREWRRGGSTCGRGWLRKQSETLRIRPHLLLVILQPFLELLTSPLALYFSTSTRWDFCDSLFMYTLAHIFSSTEWYLLRAKWIVKMKNSARLAGFGLLMWQQEESHGHPLQSK